MTDDKDVMPFVWKCLRSGVDTQPFMHLVKVIAHEQRTDKQRQEKCFLNILVSILRDPNELGALFSGTWFSSGFLWTMGIRDPFP